MTNREGNSAGSPRKAHGRGRDIRGTPVRTPARASVALVGQFSPHQPPKDCHETTDGCALWVMNDARVAAQKLAHLDFIEIFRLDWDNGLIRIRRKGSRWTQLPLPVDVGGAIAAYLQSDRPRCSSRRVFLRHRAPIRGFAHTISVSSIVRRTLIGLALTLCGQGPTCSVTPWLLTSCETGPLWKRSATFSATAGRTQRPSTRRSLWLRFANSHSPGQEVLDDEPPERC